MADISIQISNANLQLLFSVFVVAINWVYEERGIHTTTAISYLVK